VGAEAAAAGDNAVVAADPAPAMGAEAAAAEDHAPAADASAIAAGDPTPTAGARARAASVATGAGSVLAPTDWFPVSVAAASGPAAPVRSAACAARRVGKEAALVSRQVNAATQRTTLWKGGESHGEQ
jgi:hypothetical protein